MDVMLEGKRKNEKLKKVSQKGLKNVTKKSNKGSKKARLLKFGTFGPKLSIYVQQYLELGNQVSQENVA